MIMGPLWTLSIYFVIWWLVLFAVLPLGIKSHVEAGTHVEDGGDPGAPSNPNLKKKAITTTWLAAIVTAIVWVVVAFSLLPIPQLPG